MLQGDLNMMSSVLVSFKDNLLLRNHWTKSFSSWLKTIQLYQVFWEEIKGYCHLQNGEQIILKRHFVDYLYKEKNEKV